MSDQSSEPSEITARVRYEATGESEDDVTVVAAPEAIALLAAEARTRTRSKTIAYNTSARGALSREVMSSSHATFSKTPSEVARLALVDPPALPLDLVNRVVEDESWITALPDESRAVLEAARRRKPEWPNASRMPWAIATPRPKR